MRVQKVGVIFAFAAAFLPVMASAQLPATSGLIAENAGETVTRGPIGGVWDQINKLIFRKFRIQDRAERSLLSGSGDFQIWQIGPEFIVFEAATSIWGGGVTARFYWFDLQSNPIANDSIYLSGSHTGEASIGIIPGTTNFGIFVPMRQLRIGTGEVTIGLSDYHAIPVRYSGFDRTIFSDTAIIPDYARSGNSLIHAKQELLRVLTGSNPLMQFEAFAWLNRKHDSMTVGIETIGSELVADSIRFWALAKDPRIQRAGIALENSSVEWVADGAVRWKTREKSPAVASGRLIPLARKIEVTDIYSGKGGDFDHKDRKAKWGDPVVVEYEVKLPDGTKVFTHLKGNNNSPIFVLGDGQVIKGLSMGIVGMTVGGVREIKIPASLAFGEIGADVVPPGADLTYTVKLLHIAMEKTPTADGVARKVDTKFGTGAAVTSGTKVNIFVRASRINGRTFEDPKYSGRQQVIASDIEVLSRMVIGMKEGGIRRILVTNCNDFARVTGWINYEGQVLEINLLSIDSPSIKLRRVVQKIQR